MIKVKSSLDELRELTLNLPPVPKMGDFKQEKEAYTEYSMETGTCISWGLLSKPEGSVALTFLSSGGKTPKAHIDEKEFIVVIKGSLMLSVRDGKRTMMMGDYAVFAPKEDHQIRALEDVLIVGVTIPFSEHFPQSKDLP